MSCVRSNYFIPAHRSDWTQPLVKGLSIYVMPSGLWDDGVDTLWRTRRAEHSSRHRPINGQGKPARSGRRTWTSHAGLTHLFQVGPSDQMRREQGEQSGKYSMGNTSTSKIGGPKCRRPSHLTKSFPPASSIMLDGRIGVLLRYWPDRRGVAKSTRWRLAGC